MHVYVRSTFDQIYPAKKKEEKKLRRPGLGMDYIYMRSAHHVMCCMHTLNHYDTHIDGKMSKTSIPGNLEAMAGTQSNEANNARHDRCFWPWETIRNIFCFCT